MKPIDDIGSIELDATNDTGALAPPEISDEKSKEEPFGFLDVASKKAFSESEVAQAITIKFLVETLKERKSEIEQIKPFQKKFYEADRDLQVERGKAKLTRNQEIASLCLTSIGGVGMGLAIKFFEHDHNTSIAAFVLFAGIVGTGIYLKVAAK